MTAPKDKTAAPDPLATPDLGKFEKRRVEAAQMAIRNTGDGLSEAMDIDPMILHHGQEVTMILKGVVVDVQHPNIKGTEAVARKHIIRCTEAVPIEAGLVQDHFDTHRDRVRSRAEALAGIEQLFGKDGKPNPDAS